MKEIIVQSFIRSNMKSHLINVIGVTFLTLITLYATIYVVGRQIKPTILTPAPTAIQALSDGITTRLGINPIQVQTGHVEEVGRTDCPSNHSECRIDLDERLSQQIVGHAPVVAGVIAHEIGHIVEPQTPIFLKRLPSYIMPFAIILVLLAYVYLMGWKPTLIIYSSLSVLMLWVGIRQESTIGLLNIELGFLVILGALKWPVSLKTFLKIIFAILLVPLIVGHSVKDQLRHDEASADLFALRIVGKDAARQTFCYLNNEWKVRKLTSTDKFISELIDYHPTLEERFSNTGSTEADCL